ncbi:MAG: endonuclease/exonuclease/phosphatase family protein [Verrucomicrobia bacterium]|jgi:endonuclease/exonuclease/phosphatase family metal-dependent hydrolase|nr:endonuclease/exonuclease/phosphatase family protein [Verrucomicrobiota bacterium]
MMIVRSVLFTLFGLLSVSIPPAAAAETGTNGAVRIATYNLRNYLVMDRYFDGQWRPAYPKPEAEKTVVRQVITEVAPDILVLQEIGGAGFLEELRVDLARDGLEYEHAVVMQGLDEVRHVAILSKLQPQDVKQHTDLDFKYFDGRESVKRGLLEVHFSLPDATQFKLFALHLKSRFTDRKDDPQSKIRRTREAEASRNRIIEQTIESGFEHYLIAGDFNDHPNSSTLRRFEQRGDLVIGSLLEARDRRGERWTYHYVKEVRYELVDGFIASPAIEGRIKGGRGRIADFPGALEGSDHRMVFLEIGSDVQP